MAGNDANHVWQLMDKLTICMLTTWDGTDLHSRPMAARPHQEENAIYFLSDARHHTDDEVERYPKLVLAFADTGGQKYVSVSGRAEVTNDRAKIKQLWNTASAAWWESAADPNIRLLKVMPVEAQYWEGPGTVVSTIKMAIAAATGTRPDIGENRKVSM